MAIQTTIEVLRIPGTLFPRGAFDKNASYKFLNFVESGGSGYVCLQPCTGIPVNNTAYWFKFVFKGDKGDAFTYADLTAEQKAELVRDATAAAQAAASSAQSAADDAAAALQKFNTIKAAIDAIDPQSTEGSIQTLAAKQGLLEADLAALGPKIAQATKIKGDDIPAMAISNDYKLTGDGLCISDSNSRIKKYAVSAGSYVYLKLSADNEGVYQFQSSASVPVSGTNAYLIGEPVTVAVDGFVEVPTGASYLIVSESNTNTTNEVKTAIQYTVSDLSEKTDKDVRDVNSDIKSLEQEVFKFENKSYTKTSDNLSFSSNQTTIALNASNWSGYKLHYLAVSAGDVYRITAPANSYKRFNIGVTPNVPEAGSLVSNIEEWSAVNVIDDKYVVQTNGYLVICAYYLFTSPGIKVYKLLNGSKIQDLESELNTRTEETITYQFSQNGRFINTNYSVGSTCPVQQTGAAAYGYAIIQCVQGDKFILTTKGNSQYARAYAVLDNNNIVLAVAAASTPATNLEITIPSGGTTIIVNSNVSNGGVSITRKVSIKGLIVETDKKLPSLIDGVSKSVKQYFGSELGLNSFAFQTASFVKQPNRTFKEVYIADSNVVKFVPHLVRTKFVTNVEPVKCSIAFVQFSVLYKDGTYSSYFDPGLKKNTVYNEKGVFFVWDDSFVDVLNELVGFLGEHYDETYAYMQENYPSGISTTDDGWQSDVLIRLSSVSDFTNEAYDPYPLTKPLVMNEITNSSVLLPISAPNIAIQDYSLPSIGMPAFTAISTNGVVYDAGSLNVLQDDTFLEVDESAPRLFIKGCGKRLCFYDIKLDSTGIENSRNVFEYGYDIRSMETFVDQNYNVLHLSKTPFLYCSGRVCKLANDNVSLEPISDSISNPHQGDAYYPLPLDFDVTTLDLTNAYISYTVCFHRFISKVKGYYTYGGKTYIKVDTTGVYYGLNSEYTTFRRFPSIQIINCYPNDSKCVYHKSNNTLTAPVGTTSLYTRKDTSFEGIDIYLDDCICYTPSISATSHNIEFQGAKPLFAPTATNNIHIIKCSWSLCDSLVQGIGNWCIEDSSFDDSHGYVISQQSDYSNSEITSYCTIKRCSFSNVSRFCSNIAAVNMKQKYHINDCTFTDFGYCAIWIGYLVSSSSQYSKSYGCVEHCRIYYTPKYVQNVAKIAVVEDGGAIYHNTIVQRSVVRYNVIHSIYGKDSNFGIYFDDGCSNCYCFNNYIFGIASAAITMRYATGRTLPEGWDENANKYCGGNVVDNNIVIGAAADTYSVCEGNALVNGASIVSTSGYDFSTVENNAKCEGVLTETAMHISPDIMSITYPNSPFPNGMKKES